MVPGHSVELEKPDRGTELRRLEEKRKGVLLWGLISESPLLWQIQVMGKEGRGLRSRDSNDPELRRA